MYAISMNEGLSANIVLAAILLSSMILQPLEGQTSEEFKINVVITGVDSLTGALLIEVQAANGEVQNRVVDPFRDGRAGTVDLEDFVFNAEDNRQDELFNVCIESIDFPELKNCEVGENTAAKKPETVIIEAPSGIGRSPEGSTIYSPNPEARNHDEEVYDDDKDVHYPEDGQDGDPPSIRYGAINGRR